MHIGFVSPEYPLAQSANGIPTYCAIMAEELERQGRVVTVFSLSGASGSDARGPERIRSLHFELRESCWRVVRGVYYRYLGAGVYVFPSRFVDHESGLWLRDAVRRVHRHYALDVLECPEVRGIARWVRDLGPAVVLRLHTSVLISARANREHRPVALRGFGMAERVSLNGARFVTAPSEGIRSILDQTFRDFELIIINDGSTDRSLGIAEEYAHRDGRIRLIDREHRGITPTRRELLAASKGKYYAMMDSDDAAVPDRLEKQVKHLERHADCVCVSCQMLLVDPEGAPIRTINLETTHEEIDNANMRGDRFYVTGAYLVRREVLVEMGGFRDFPLAQDLDMFLRLAERGCIATLPEIVYKYRQHLNNNTCSRWQELNRCVRVAVEGTCERRGLPAEQGAARILPGKSVSRSARLRMWAWWALSAGYVKTARKHAFAVLRKAPLSVESWRVADCAWRGR